MAPLASPNNGLDDLWDSQFRGGMGITLSVTSTLNNCVPGYFALNAAVVLGIILWD